MTREKTGASVARTVAVNVLIAMGVLTTSPAGLAQPGLTRARVVGYGVRHLEFTLPGPFMLDVLELTLPNPYVHLETFRPADLMTTSGQAAENDHEGHRVVGAVNGDFFSAGGAPAGNQVAQGIFVQGIASSRSHLAVDLQERPMIERLSFVGSVSAEVGISFALTGVNVTRLGGALVMYTRFWGPATPAVDGVEAAFEFPGSGVSAGDTMRVRIASMTAGGQTPIPANGGVLSAAPGSPAGFLSSFKAGDTLSIALGFEPSLRHIGQAIGGAGRILLAGRNVTDSMAHLEGITANFTDVRNPRTFAGFNRDTTRFFLCTVDGRQASSAGMTFDEMASFLVSLGVTNAFNLDGGGSTTMVVRGETVNSPSDPGGERGVANTVQLISTAPPGALTNLVVLPGRCDAVQGQPLHFVAAGTNEYLDPVPLPSGLSWEVDARLGSITPAGLFTANAIDDSGWVIVSWGGVRDSARVVVHTLTAIAPRSPAYVMAAGESVTMRVLGTTSGGATVALPDSLLTWTPASPVLSMEGPGIVRATVAGSATLNVQYGGLNCQVLFDCRGKDTTVNADPLGRLDDWTVSRVNTDEQETAVSLANDPLSARRVLLIDHSHLDGPKGVDFITVLPLGGHPDSLALRVYGSGNGDTVRLTGSDGNGASFSIPPGGVVDWANEWRDVGFRTDRAETKGSTELVFPIVVDRVQVRFGNGGEPGGFVQGLLYLADLRAHYPERAGTGVGSTVGSPAGTFGLMQNYPNPFNPTTEIGFQVPSTCRVRLAVFDLLGRDVAVLMEGVKAPGTYNATFDGTGLAGGVYFSCLTAGSAVQVRKLLLLR